MGQVRPPAVAGRFYPADAAVLRKQVATFLAPDPRTAGILPTPSPPTAIIAPHAGYRYSGPIAGSAFAPWQGAQFRRVILLGPPHYVYVPHMALSSAAQFATPLGNIDVDQGAMAELDQLADVMVQDEAHRPEHSLEVELPFLQCVLPGASIVPILVGEAPAAAVAQALLPLLADSDTCLVVSSDLSHFFNQQKAAELDATTASDILNLTPLQQGQACGYRAVNGLLKIASMLDLQPSLLDLRNSGDTSPARDRVVGYGAFAFQRR